MKTYLSSLRKAVNEVLAFSYRNYAVTKNEFYAIFEMLFWPVISMLTIGLLGQFLSLSSREIAFILIGVISLSVIQIVQIDVSYVVLLDMWSLSLKYTVVTPVPLYRMVIGAWFFGIFRGLISFVILVILSQKFFGFVLEIPLNAIFIFLTGIFLCSLLIGITNCTLILVFGRRAEIFAWTLTATIMIFCGIYYPVNILPEPFKTLGLLIPITHFLEYFRTFYGFEATWQPLISGFGEVFVYLLFLLILAEVSMNRARKNGLVMKLSG
ncbi:MAG: ABC transporter permease [Archaeoglobaceae archaeon]